jgi:hypothetical protein
MIASASTAPKLLLKPRDAAATLSISEKTLWTWTKAGRIPCVTCDAGVNWRTHMLRIISRAGLESWPRLFHNLRATRQTELTNRYPQHVVCRWMGNSHAVAQEHYLRMTDEHFEQATIAVDEAAQNAAQYTFVNARKGKESKPAIVVIPEGNEGLRTDTSVPVLPSGIEPLTSGL